MFAKIKPFKVQFSGIAARMDCVAIVKLGGFADIEVRLSDAAGAVLWTGMSRMSGDDYALWSNDDAHVFQWVAKSLGCEIDEMGVDQPVHATPQDALGDADHLESAKDVV